MTTIKGEIVGLRKLNNSRNGNPRYTIRIRTHERGLYQNVVDHKTATDAGFAYAIYDGYKGKFGQFTINGRNQITDMQVELG